MRQFPKGEKYPGFFERSNTPKTTLRLRDNRDVRPPREALEHLAPIRITNARNIHLDPSFDWEELGRLHREGF